jgi:hypothetical protein
MKSVAYAVLVFLVLSPLLTMQTKASDAQTAVQIVGAQTFDSWGNPNFLLNRGKNMTASVELNTQLSGTFKFSITVFDEANVPVGFTTQNCKLAVGQNVLNFTLIVASFAYVGVGKLAVIVMDADNIAVCPEYDTVICIQQSDASPRTQPSALTSPATPAPNSTSAMPEHTSIASEIPQTPPETAPTFEPTFTESASPTTKTPSTTPLPTSLQTIPELNPAFAIAALLELTGCALIGRQKQKKKQNTR